MRSGVAWFEHGLGLTFLDQLEDDRTGAVGRVQRSGLLAVLAGEHELEQRGVADREPHVAVVVARSRAS